MKINNFCQNNFSRSGEYYISEKSMEKFEEKAFVRVVFRKGNISKLV
jgi:hypothetical protein